MAADRLADLEERRDLALQRMASVTGAVGVCAVAKSGESFPAAKFHEGAGAALADVRRGLRSGGDPGGVLTQVLAAWQAQRAAAADRGPDWQAYRAGGVEELQALQESWT